MRSRNAQHDVQVFRLVGEVADKRLEFVLSQGENPVGAQPDNAIALGAHDVSRRHAIIRVEDSDISIEDLSSTNGTWVNGVRITRAKLGHDDWIQFGSLLLTLEAVAPDELEMGIQLPGAQSPAADAIPNRDASTGLGGPRKAPLQWLNIVDDVCRSLFAHQPPNAHAALQTLIEALNGETAALLKSDRGITWLVEAAAGRVDALGDSSAIRSLRGQSTEDSAPVADIVCGVVPGTPPRLAAVRKVSGARSEALIVTGKELNADMAPLLGPLLRLVSGCTHRPEAPTTQPTEEQRALVFPSGHVRGLSRASRHVYGQLRSIIDSTVPVLITGETGVGKEHVVHILHHSSGRASAPLEVVNCAAIPAELLEAELFGIEKGVATGVEGRRGKFQAADGGALFFDEVGDMPPALQAKLLRALQESEVHPVGARTAVPVDVRIVAATNTELGQKIENGTFRSDLFYRLAGCEIHVPALRDRPEDIPELVRHFLELFAAESGKTLKGVSLRALRQLQDAPWPGNIRQLEHEVRRLVSLCPDGGAIESSMLSPEISEPPAASRTVAGPDTLHLKTRVDALESQLVNQAVEQAQGNLAEAARILGLSRNGLVMKMERLGLWEKS